MFGPHLHVNSRTRLNVTLLRSVGFWVNALEELVARAEMRILHPPIVVDSSCSNASWDPPDATGLTGFVVLAQSHAAFHTFAESRVIFLDVFSCMPFPAEFEGWLREHLKLIDPIEPPLLRYWPDSDGSGNFNTAA